ncbi:MAG: hypothetical protein R3E02_06940 [Blastomonas sp.]
MTGLVICLAAPVSSSLPVMTIFRTALAGLAALCCALAPSPSAAQTEAQKAEVQQAYQQYVALLSVRELAAHCDYVGPITQQAALYGARDLRGNLIRIGAISQEDADAREAQMASGMANVDCDESISRPDLRGARLFAEFKAEEYFSTWHHYRALAKAHEAAGGAISDFGCGPQIPWADIDSAGFILARATGKLAARPGGQDHIATVRKRAAQLRATCLANPDSVLQTSLAPMLKLAMETKEF